MLDWLREASAANDEDRELRMAQDHYHRREIVIRSKVLS